MPHQPVPFFAFIGEAPAHIEHSDRIMLQSPTTEWQRYAVSDVRALAKKRVIACPAGSLVPVGVIAAYGSKQAKLDAVRNPSPNGLVRVKPQVIGGVRSHGILVPYDDLPESAGVEFGRDDPASAVLDRVFASKPAAQSKTLTTAQVASVAVILLALIDAFVSAVEGIVLVLGDESEPCAK